MKLKRVATMTAEEATEHDAICEEESELQFRYSEYNIKRGKFWHRLVKKHGLLSDKTYRVKKRGIFTEGE